MLMYNLQKLERNCCREKRHRKGTWMGLKPVRSADEENWLVIAARVDWELSCLSLVTLGRGGEASLGGGECLGGEEEL